MTQQVVGYEYAVYYNEISNKVFEKNISSLKDIIDEITIIGNFEDVNYSNQNFRNLNLDLVDQMMDNIINNENLNNKLTTNYGKAENFITKYS